MTNWLWDKITDAGHAITGTPTADEKRHTQKAMNDQIKAYREQTELSRQELNRKRGEEAAEKRKIEEKQIRSLRRNRGAGGGLIGSPTTDQPGMTEKLGG